MNEQDVRAAMKTYRWSFICRMRRNHAYIYAARKVGGKREERYIAPLKGLEALTVEALIAKLTDIVAQNGKVSKAKPRMEESM